MKIVYKYSFYSLFLNSLSLLIFGVLFFLQPSNLLFGQCLSSEKDFLDYSNLNSSLNPIEGVWVGSLTIRAYRFNKQIEQRVEAENEKYIIREFSGKYIMCFEGDKFALLTATASENNFLFSLSLGENSVEGKAEILDAYRLKLSFTERDYENFGTEGDPYIVFEFNLIKTLPIKRKENPIISKSGTAWALNSEGFVVTNYHVIEGGTSYQLKGFSDDDLKSYNLRLLGVDINNDLAILKVVDNEFTGFEKVPYVINTKAQDVGTSIFVLGFPLRGTMGDEVKLTDGIISSKTGFKGDISLYQISAPIQSGNSGGPLFNKEGELIGIVSSKHSLAENASYAIKTSYLKIFIESLDQTIKLNDENGLKNLDLPGQVKLLKKSTFIIEVK